ncbi:MAG TPA: amidohydrolase, partial [Methylomirabilota bacterium]
MPHYLSDEELKRTAPAEVASFRSPVPTQIVSNGEFNPLPQTREQQRVEARIKELADDLGRRHGMDRRQFLASSAGMAAAFLAMNDVFGPIFDVSRAEAANPEVAAQRAGMLSGQFIFDDQTHFVRDDFKQEGLLGLAQYAKQHWNPALWGEKTLARFKLENYLKEIFVDSDTKVALLSGAPFDDQTWDLLSNDQIAMARAAINKIADSRRLLGHAVFTPKRQGWMNEVDRAISTLKPDSWKGYTIGDPLFPSKVGSTWWLDDEKLMYSFYEKIAKSGITTVCIHKGLLPVDYEKSWPG